MHYRTLGRTGIAISELSLGTVQLGMPYGIPDASGQLPFVPEAEALEILRQGLREGVNFLDTARGYGDSEALIARALHKHSEDVFVATKLEPLSEAMTDDEIAKSIRNAIETSRRTLQREALDILQVHNATEALLDREVIPDLLAQARDREWIRFQGVSTYGAKAPLKAIDQGYWDTVQVEFNVFNQATRGVFEAAQTKNVGVLVRSAMLKGVMTTPAEAMPDALKALAKQAQHLPDFFERRDVSVPQAALLYVLSHPQVSSVLCGVLNVSQLMENLATVEAPQLTAEQLEAARVLHVEDSHLTDPRQWTLEAMPAKSRRP